MEYFLTLLIDISLIKFDNIIILLTILSLILLN